MAVLACTSRAARAGHVALLAAAIGFVGCAGPRLDAQWSDPGLAPGALRGAQVLVACEAYDAVVKHICQDQLASEVTARGATAVIAPDLVNPSPGRRLPDEQYLAAARNAGARAVLTATLTPSGVGASPAMSIGVGGFSMGGGGFGAGVGISAPIGGGQGATGYAVDGRVTDAASGRLLWTAKASTPGSADLNAQLSELAKTVLGAADRAGLF